MMNTITPIIAAQQNDLLHKAFNSHVSRQWEAGNNYRVRYVGTESGFLVPREKFFMNANDLADWYTEQSKIARESAATFLIDQMWIWIGREVEVDDFTSFIKRLN